jgi:phage recombination protein Bet
MSKTNQVEQAVQTEQKAQAQAQSGSSQKRKLVAKMAEKFGVDANAFWETLKATAFKQRNGDAPTNEQMMALMVVADQYDLNPFTKEIYAFPDQNGGIIPVVGIDGWSRIINSHPNYDGMEFRFSENKITPNGLDKPIFEWIECVMYRNDRTRPTVIREYLDEIYKEPIKKQGSQGVYFIKTPWQTHTRRFARHKVIIQTARIALGYTGIYDQDEADNILENQQATASKGPKSNMITFETHKALSSSVNNDASDLLNQLSQTEFSGIDDIEEAELVPVKQSPTEQLAEETRSIPKQAIVQTEFGSISAKDHTMITQMIDYTAQTGAWKVTFESFNERYSGDTLEFALSKLTDAQVENQ